MATHEELAAKPPRTRGQIRAFVKKQFGFSIPDKSVCAGHDTPMDYLVASFLGQEDLLVWANRGGGKTMLAAIATLLDAIFHAPARIRVLGGSFDQSDRLAEYIRDILNEHPELQEGRMTRHRVRVKGGSDIRMLAQSQQAVRGQHVQKIRCDEVDLFDAEVWRAVQFSTRSRDGARGSIEVLSTLHRAGGLMQRLVDRAQENLESGPSPKRNRKSKIKNQKPGYRLVRWCLWEVIERCPRRRRCEDCLLADDCRGVARTAGGFFPIDDAIAIKARSSRAAWETEMLCLGAQREWLVFSEFQTPRHVMEVQYSPDWPLYRAIDFGYRSPLVCLWIQVTPTGRVHVLNEYAATRLPLPRHAAEIKSRDPGPATATYVDPAGRQRESTSGAACTELLAAAGIPCISRGSAIADGIELVRAALAPAAGETTLAIHPRCTGLIEAFNSYHYPPPDAKNAAGDKPVKDGPDHFIDALRYFFVNRMRPKIKIVRGRY